MVVNFLQFVVPPFFSLLYILDRSLIVNILYMRKLIN